MKDAFVGIRCELLKNKKSPDPKTNGYGVIVCHLSWLILYISQLLCSVSQSPHASKISKTNSDYFEYYLAFSPSFIALRIPL